LIEAHCWNAERLEFIDDCTVALCIEQLVISRQHKECPNRDPVQGECDVGPSDTIEQYIYHCCCSFPRRYVGPVRRPELAAGDH